jgi:hypothetical protein
MQITEILTLIALLLNFIALLVVAYQTYLNRRSLTLTKQSIDNDRKTRQIELLPKAHYIFEVQNHLNAWLKDIEEINLELQKAIETMNIDALKNLSKKALKSPSGLVHRSSYEKGPTWLSEIWLAGAQYYYSYHAPLNDVWIEREQRPFWELASDIIKRGCEYSYHLKNLLSYIDNAVPESYADAPARISDIKFLSE